MPVGIAGTGGIVVYDPTPDPPIRVPDEPDESDEPPADAPADSDEPDASDSGTARTLDELRTTSGGQTVDRKPIFSSGDIDVKAGEWPLGFPLQGIPRVAAVINLNYVYDEERGEWRRQRPFRGSTRSTGAGVIDDFNDGNLDEYAVTEKGVFTVQTSTAIEGTHALRGETQNKNFEGVLSRRGLNTYPGEEKRITFRFRATSKGNPQIFLGWFVQSAPFGENSIPDGYYYRINIEGGQLIVEKRQDNRRTASNNVTFSPLPTDTWLRGVIEIAGDTYTCEAYDAGGNQVGAVSLTDSEYDPAGILIGISDLATGTGMVGFVDIIEQREL